jgi:hypothetical protein
LALYFDDFRAAIAELPDGLIRAGDPASRAELDAAERALTTTLGRGLGAELTAFLTSWNGADLFHELLVVFGVGDRPERSLERENLRPRAAPIGPGDLAIAETASGDLMVLRQERVRRLRGPSASGWDETWLSGSSFHAWLRAVIARDRLLYDRDGEFKDDVFDPDGEVLPTIAVRQAERGLRQDPGSSELEHERGVALRRLGRIGEAAEAFARAADLDPGNPWPWFDLGRARLLADEPAAAVAAFQSAAAASTEDAARLWTWSAHAARTTGDEAARAHAAAHALARDPDIRAALARAAEAARDEGDEDAYSSADALVQAFEPVRRKLPLATEPSQTAAPSAPEPPEGSARASGSPPGPRSGPRRPRPAPPRPPSRPRRGGTR